MADRRPGGLDVVGQLMVQMGGTSARIEARGDRIAVEIPDFRAGASVLRGWSKNGGSRQTILRIQDLLTATGLTLEVIVGGSTVGVLGVGARPGLISRLLGLGRLEVRARGVLGTLRRTDHRPE